MDVLLKIKDHKATFVLELLNGLASVKTEIISPTKAQFIKELKGSIKEVKLAKKGKLKLKSADTLLNELLNLSNQLFF